MTKPSIFISHSSYDKKFATDVVKALRQAKMAPWIDKELIHIGTDILEEIGKGLTAMDLFVLIVSTMANDFGWVQKEISYAAYREINEKKALILPFVVDQTKLTDLPWYIQNRNIARITPNHSGVEAVVDAVRHSLELRETAKDQARSGQFKQIAEVDILIKRRSLGDLVAAE